MDNDFVICYNLFIIIRTISLMVPIKVYAGIPTPHRPVYVEVYSPPGITDKPLNCVHDALLLREALSPLPAFRGPGRNSFLAPHGLLSLRNIPAPTFPGLPPSLSAFISQSISLLI